MEDQAKRDKKLDAPNLASILQAECIRQTELSRDSGIRKETLCRLINGKQKVSKLTLNKILRSIHRLSGNYSYTIECIRTQKKEDMYDQILP